MDKKTAKEREQKGPLGYLLVLLGNLYLIL